MIDALAGHHPRNPRDRKAPVDVANEPHQAHARVPAEFVSGDPAPVRAPRPSSQALETIVVLDRPGPEDGSDERGDHDHGHRADRERQPVGDEEQGKRSRVTDIPPRVPHRGHEDNAHAAAPGVAPPPSYLGRLVPEVGRRSGSCAGTRRLVIGGNGSRSLRPRRIRSRTRRLRDTAGHVEGRTSLDSGMRLGPKWDQLGPLMSGNGPRWPPCTSDESTVGIGDLKGCPQRDSNPCCRLERAES